jgi:hypothetical protein
MNEIVRAFDGWLSNIRQTLQEVEGISQSLSSEANTWGWLKEDLEWDIYLTTANEIKERISSISLLEDEERLNILTTPMPRFIWYAGATLQTITGEKNMLDILFDATDIEQGDLIIKVIEYDKNFSEFLRQTFVDAIDFTSSIIPSKVSKWFTK